LRDDDPADGRGQHFGQQAAADLLQAGTQAVQREEQHQRDGHADQQHQQRLAALAGQHAVEDLQHEQRRDEQQQVDEERQARHMEQRASQQAHEGFHGRFADAGRVTGPP
jgi:hypothetical protein